MKAREASQSSHADNKKGVRTLVPIPIGCVLGMITEDVEIGQNLTDAKLVEPKLKLKATYDGQLSCSEERWLEEIRSARNRHEQNVEAVRGEKRKLILRTIRSIQSGQEILVWYGEELGRELNIPILTPINIKGSNDYRCSSCSASFQHPNVLKAHIRFKCSSSLSGLLGCSDEPLNLSKRTTLQQQHQPIQIFNHIHAPAFALPAALLYPTLYPTSTPFYPQFLPSGPSPPAPQVKSEPNTETHLPPTFPLPSEKDGEPIDLLPRSLYMNKSNKGHLCIYCGKLYSRKYGLKIHLRTHTGYKPLKCKICLRPFGDPSNLNKHIRLHAEGDTPYRCHLCGKVLVRRRDLDRHIRSRHPVDSTKNHSDSLPPEEEEEEIEELETIEGELSDGGVADDEEEIEVVV